MSITPFPVRQCTSASCRFRYPITEEGVGVDKCPCCGAPTRQVALIHGRDLPRVEAGPEGPTFEALLDNIRSAYNVGSMFRTADGAGIRHMHLCGVTPLPDHPRVAKTALGAERSVPWTHYRNGLDAAFALKREGFRVWGIECCSRARPIYEVSSDIDGPPIVLVVGNEIAGIDPGILAQCDSVLSIPMQGLKASLNVAVAFGAAVYCLRYALPRRSA